MQIPVTIADKDWAVLEAEAARVPEYRQGPTGVVVLTAAEKLAAAVARYVEGVTGEHGAYVTAQFAQKVATLTTDDKAAVVSLATEPGRLDTVAKTAEATKP